VSIDYGWRGRSAIIVKLPGAKRNSTEVTFGLLRVGMLLAKRRAIVGKVAFPRHIWL